MTQYMKQLLVGKLKKDTPHLFEGFDKPLKTTVFTQA